MTARIGKRFWRIIVIALILALPIYYYTRGGADAAKFVTAPVTRGPIVRSVTATGTINPVTTVQVGLTFRDRSIRSTSISTHR